VELVLNDLSFTTVERTHYEARSLMEQYVRTLAAATRGGAAKVLHSVVDINMLLLAADYPIARWRNDDLVEIDIVRLFKSLVTRAPSLPANLADGLVEYRFEGEEAPALGFAYLEESLAVSLASNASWDAPLLSIEENSVEADGDLTTSHVQVLHAATEAHVADHGALLCPPTPPDGTTMWLKRDELYPGLTFLDGIEGELAVLGSNDHRTGRVHRRLSELSAFMTGWDSGPLDANALPMRMTRDSQATLQQFSEERTFVLPDGTGVVFSWHVKIGSRTRIYVHFVGPGECFVGYIGAHLRTVRFAN